MIKFRKSIIVFITLMVHVLPGLGQNNESSGEGFSDPTRYVTRSTMYGVGFTNVFDTYLSPQEYKGIDFRISRETMRMTKLFDGNVSVQNFFQADLGYTHNRADNNNAFPD